MSLPLAYLDLSGGEDDGDARVQAVRIACDGEVQELDVPKLQPFTISAFDDAFYDDYSIISDISRFLGFPLTARKIELDWRYKINSTNDEAASLFRNCDIGAVGCARPAFGAVPELWASDTGPVAVARVDKKPLHPLHVAAVIAFLRDVMQEPFQECMDVERAWGNLHGAKEMIFERRREVLAAATPARFAEFFQEYRSRRAAGRPELMRPFHQLSYSQRTEVQSMSADELEPRPEWTSVAGPLER